MAKNSETLHRVAATFQGGRDPDQDAVIQWLGTLPKDEKGQLRRSVLKYHLQRALLHYINSGLANSQSVGVAPSAQPMPTPASRPATQVAAPAVPVFAAPATATPVPTAATNVEHDIPTLTETVMPVAAPAPTSTAPVEGKKAGGGGLLRSRIAKSMNVSSND